MKRFFAVLALCAVTIFSAVAEEKAKTYTQAEYECCYQLFSAMGTAKTMDGTIETTMELQVKNLPPQMQGLKPIMMDFFRKYMSYEALKKDLAELYLRHFTVAEIKELTKFYSTSLGKKLSEKQPFLVVEGMQMGQKKVQAHIGELQQAVMAEVQKQQGKGTKNVK